MTVNLNFLLFWKWNYFVAFSWRRPTFRHPLLFCLPTSVFPTKMTLLSFSSATTSSMRSLTQTKEIQKRCETDSGAISNKMHFKFHNVLRHFTFLCFPFDNSVQSSSTHSTNRAYVCFVGAHFSQTETAYFYAIFCFSRALLVLVFSFHPFCFERYAWRNSQYFFPAL